MEYTIPGIPEDLHPAGCWRRQLTDLDWQATGGFRAVGVHLHPGDTVELPEGALLLRVDKNTRGWEENFRSRGRHPIKDATVTVYLADQGELRELWSRHYQRDKSAFGAFTMKKLAAFLDKHPTPEGQPVVVHEARRPNLGDGDCRWCTKWVPKGQGHRVRGEDDEMRVEHYQQCPELPVTTGDVCTRCGVTVFAHNARKILLREGAGRWEIHHRARGVTDCRHTPVASVEQTRAETAERDREERERAEQQKAKREADRKRREKKRREKEEREQAAHDAEQARVAQLTTTDRTSTTLYDKGIGGGLRTCLLEHEDTLSDGTTTTRWSVRTYPEGSHHTGHPEMEPDDPTTDLTTEEFTTLKSARSHYQTYQWNPKRSSTGRSPASSTGRSCWECGRRGATIERQDSSGIPGWVCAPCDRQNPEFYMLSFA